MTKFLMGNIVAEKLYSDLLYEVGELREAGCVPKLKIVRANQDSGCEYYENAILKKCREVGIDCEVMHFDEKMCTQKEIVDTVSNCRQEKSAVLVLMPLPAHIDRSAVLSAIDADCDVDCLNSASLGQLLFRNTEVAPCTAKSVMKILEYYDIDLSGKNVCVVGRSQIVGKPLSSLFLEKDATVTICHSKTLNLKKYSNDADIVVFCVGKPSFFGKEYVNEKSVVIDVGTSSDKDGCITGDANFNELNGYVSAITPVRGGVGACTTACLLSNVVICCKRMHGYA